MRKLLLLFFVVFLISCGSLPQRNTYLTVNSSVELGTVGEKDVSLHKTAFQTTGIPTFKKGIRMQVLTKPFDKKNYKLYLKNRQFFNKKEDINFSKEAKITPTYINLILSDRVAIVNAINNNDLALFNYIKQVPNIKLVIGIKLVATANIQEQIQEADAYYLQTNKHKKQLLHLYKNEKETAVIDLSKTTVFGYQLASFCWGITPRKQIQLFAITDTRSNCTESTKREVQELEEELTKNSIKF